LRLAEIIEASVPKIRGNNVPHPAMRTFMALRIAVNDELSPLAEALQNAAKLLKKGGRIAVISFHSLEDRIVKNFFRTLAEGCTCPPEFPLCVCNNKPRGRLVNRKPITAGGDELSANSRSRSAKLRVIEKLSDN
jgi:16S rRNA (cytosine1402-N4)-methyltransferase